MVTRLTLTALPDMARRYYIILPWFDRLGPADLADDRRIDGVLPAGRYMLKGRLAEGQDVEVVFDLQPDAELRLAPGAGLDPAALRSADHAGGAATLLILPERRQAAQFWLGNCDSEARLDDFLAPAPVGSGFSCSQAQQCDCDAALRAAGQSFDEWLGSHPDAFGWREELTARAGAAGLSAANCVIIVSGDASRAGWQVAAPTDISLPGISLHHMGQIRWSGFDIPPYWWRCQPD
ncbi:MAG: hypothetical protein Q4G25_04540 [Paracoccus sp. (in: a-proteobacteria)]|nr:hypothetical protein [Paracoccus sp. (in: a-proteobacteria)]